MPDQPKALPGELDTDAAPAIVCGDCRQRVQPQPHGGDARAASMEDSRDWYCPCCARTARGRRECPECRSAICADCGAVLELVDELGIG
jgi:hypothetical protein